MPFSNGISLVYVEELEDDSFHKFARELNKIGIQATTNPSPQACVEWLMPTAIIAGISAGFLNEAGKELFHQLKRKLADFTSGTIKKPRIEPVLFGTKGKLREDNPYSSAISMYSEAKMNRRFRLLIPKYSTNTDYDKVVFAYLDFLKDDNDGLATEADIGIEPSISLHSAIIVHYNESIVCNWRLRSESNRR